MKSLIAFIKKEVLEHTRSGRLGILLLLFALLGIMNPAIAKLTPWLFEIMAEDLAESGMIVTQVTVDAMTSWTQFFKNVPMGLLAFVLMESNGFTKEYQSGSLILALTKGLKRYKVFIAKTSVWLCLWTVCYWISFGITYLYNSYFWDNGIASHLFFAVTLWWLFGIWVLLIMAFFSVLSRSNTQVLCGTGAVVLGVYVLSFLPKVKAYVPTRLMESMSLLLGVEKIQEYTKALVVTGIWGILCIGMGIILFNRKQI